MPMDESNTARLIRVYEREISDLRGEVERLIHANAECAAVITEQIDKLTEAAAYLDEMAKFFDVPREGLYEHKAAECRAMARKLRDET